MQKVSLYYAFIVLIFVIKSLFFLSILRVIYAKLFNKSDINVSKEWKKIFENTFMILMALLIFYLFQKDTIKIGKEEYLLFTMFASVILLNAIQEIML
jgi:hypothetical protein